MVNIFELDCYFILNNYIFNNRVIGRVLIQISVILYQYLHDSGIKSMKKHSKYFKKSLNLNDSKFFY